MEHIPKRCAARLLAALGAALTLHAAAAERPYSPLETRLAPKGVDAKAKDSDAAPASNDKRPGGTPDPTYYKHSLLDAKPHIVTKVDPAYPAGVPPTGGKARIRLFINERGLVDEVKVVESAPVARFGEVAAQAFRAAQFAPGRRAGNAVKSQVLIEVEFHPVVPSKPK